MITEFGKTLRLIRIKRGEKQLDMARKIGVTNHYLSMLETTNRAVPEWIIDGILEVYKLTSEETKGLFSSCTKSAQSIKIRLDEKSVNDDKRSLLVEIINRIKQMDVEELKTMMHLMEGV